MDNEIILLNDAITFNRRYAFLLNNKVNNLDNLENMIMCKILEIKSFLMMRQNANELKLCKNNKNNIIKANDLEKNEINIIKKSEYTPYFIDSTKSIPDNNEDVKLLENIKKKGLSIQDTLRFPPEKSIIYTGDFNAAYTRIWSSNLRSALTVAVERKCQEKRILLRNSFIKDIFSLEEWNSIIETSRSLKGVKTPFQCKLRWEYFESRLRYKIKPHIWNDNEDKYLKDLVENNEINHMNNDWFKIAEKLNSFINNNNTANKLSVLPYECLKRYQRIFMIPKLKTNWTYEEDEILTEAVKEFDVINWKDIADFIEGKTATQCKRRYENTIADDINFNKWNSEENRKLALSYYIHYGQNEKSDFFNCISMRQKNQMINHEFNTENDNNDEIIGNKRKFCWLQVAKFVKGRTPFQCREKWTDTLNPFLDNSKFTPEEDDLLRKYVHEYGEKNWALISKKMDCGKTDNRCRRRWVEINKRKELNNNE